MLGATVLPQWLPAQRSRDIRKYSQTSALRLQWLGGRRNPMGCLWFFSACIPFCWQKAAFWILVMRSGRKMRVPISESLGDGGTGYRRHCRRLPKPKYILKKSNIAGQTLNKPCAAVKPNWPTSSILTLEYYTTLRVSVCHRNIRRQKVHYPAHKSPLWYHFMSHFKQLPNVMTNFSDNLFHDRSFTPDSPIKMLRATHTAHPIILYNFNIIRRRWTQTVHLLTAELSYFLGCDSSVGTATRYGLDGPGIDCRWRRVFPHPSRPGLGSTQRPIQWVPGLYRR